MSNSNLLGEKSFRLFERILLCVFNRNIIKQSYISSLSFKWILRDRIFSLLVFVFVIIIADKNRLRDMQQRGLLHLKLGYKQSQAFIHDVFFAVEKYLHKPEHWSKAFDILNYGTKGISFYLYLLSYIHDFQLPWQWTKWIYHWQKHIANRFWTLCLIMVCKQAPHCVHMKRWVLWRCDMKWLHQNCCLLIWIQLRPPVLVIPVSDMETLQPLSSMTEYGISSASLPSQGMIACLKVAGGKAPTLWNEDIQAYDAGKNWTLRDVLVLKPGSTVEDAFISLKNIGIQGCEFLEPKLLQMFVINPN